MPRDPRHRQTPRKSPAACTARLIGTSSTRGHLTFGGMKFPCTIGRSGRKARKREGDGATPVGSWRLIEVLYRADRVLRPPTVLPCRPIRPDDGWCDAATDRNYNRRVRHPYSASAERLWRGDRLYDLVVVLGYNCRPRVKGRGSAIFMHLAHPEPRPTAGCVALSARDLRLVLKLATRRAVLHVPA